MIIIGYPGIGKTTFCETYFPSMDDRFNGKEINGYIDLESSWISKSIVHWEETYCRIAIGLSKQGFVVFVSAHENVQNILEKSDEEVVVAIYPGLELKEQWIERLQKRYDADPTGKNELALLTVKANYDRHIKKLMNRKFYKYELSNMDYSLFKIITHEKDLWA